MDGNFTRRTGKIIAALFVAILLTAPMAPAFTAIPADDYIKFTFFCPNLVVIRVKEVKEKSVGVEDGMENFEVTLTGEVVEVVRGKHVGKEFLYVTTETRMVDREAARRAKGDEFLDMASSPPPHRASECKAGHLYLVLPPAVMDAFIEIKEGDETWRARSGFKSRKF